MRIVLLICLSLFVFQASAQVIEKGEKFFGGSFGSNSSTSTQNNYEHRNSNAGLYPALAFGIRQNLVFGVRGQLSYGRSKITQGVGQLVQTGFGSGLGLFVKKYRPLQERFGIYFDHTVSGGFVEQSITDYNNTTTQNNSWNAGYQFSPGAFFRFSERFLGEANIGGLYANYYDGPGEGNGYALGASFLQSFTVGIMYRFGKWQAQQGQ